MQLWTIWLGSLRDVLEFLSSNVGLGSGLAIIALTLAIRFALLPASWFCAYRGCIRQKKIRTIQPELERIRRQFRDRPRNLGEEVAKLYRRKNLSVLDTAPILGSLVQLPVLLGMFNVLRQGWRQARFLWIANLSRPDVWLALIAGVTTALIVLANPDLPETARQLLILVPSLLAFVFALKFASAVALYWVASNCFTAAQTRLVHFLVDRRIRSGAIDI